MIYELIEGGRPPVMPRDGDAGYDVFARLNGAVTLNGATFEAPDSASHITIPRFSTAVIPLGFRAALPKGYHADLRARSSWSSRGVHVSLGLIDEGYRGEWAAVVTPTCEGGVTIEHGAKIGQFVLRLTYIEELVEGDVDIGTDRGEGGFGSTDGRGRPAGAAETEYSIPHDPHPFTADTMRPDVSLPGEDPAQAQARARWMAAHHHGAGCHEWDAEHPAPIEAIRAYIDDENGGSLGYSDSHALLGEIEDLRELLDRASADRAIEASNSKAAIAELWSVAEAIGYDDESGMPIADRGAELLDGAIKMERAIDSIALTLGLSQGLNERHIDYVRRVAGAVRALRDEHEILKGRTTRRHPTASS